jgi:hypothetical protein
MNHPHGRCNNVRCAGCNPYYLKYKSVYDEATKPKSPKIQDMAIMVGVVVLFAPVIVVLSPILFCIGLAAFVFNIFEE